MYVILTQDVPRLGSKNALLDVSDGHYSNYLFPRGLASRATVSKIDSLKEDLIEQQKSKLVSSKLAHEQLEALTQIVLSISAKSSDKGTLFQAISEKDIVASIKKQCGFNVDPSSVHMEHIKNIGEHTIDIQFEDKVARVIVFVEASKE